MKTSNPAGGGPARQGMTDGFTLIEVMATLVIVSVVLLSILATQSRNLEDAKRSRSTRYAGILAQRTLEEALIGLEPIEDDLPAGFSISVTNLVEIVGEEQQVVQVVVEVSYPGRKGQESLVLSSYRLPLEGEDLEALDGGSG